MPYSDEITLLIVEDDEIDQMIIERALSRQGIANPVEKASDGVDALEKMRGENGNVAVQRPFVVLLDMHMPRMGGMEFLRTIREDPDLKATVVFVLSTSGLMKDIQSAYEYGVAGYIVKEDAGRDFIKLAQLIEVFRITVRLPQL